jgi:hypothetical protein
MFNKKKSLIVVIALFFSLSLAPTSFAEQGTTPNEVVLQDWYRVTFTEVQWNEDGTMTWFFWVEELGDGKDLSHWVIELPDGAQVVSASPSPYEVGKDKRTGIDYGIKWETGDSFTSGEFSVTVSGADTVSGVWVATKGGPNSESDFVASPSGGVDGGGAPGDEGGSDEGDPYVPPDDDGGFCPYEDPAMCEEGPPQAPPPAGESIG